MWTWATLCLHLLSLIICTSFPRLSDALSLPEEVNEIIANGKPFLEPPPQSACLQYSIFGGKSSLRNLASREQDWIQTYGKSASALLLFLTENRQYADAAHEVILGVTPWNVPEAEYAATHPGSGWMAKHPLSTVDDWIHAIIHRDGEGNLTGEGNHTGWENSMYWAAGGPKALPADSVPSICTHPVAIRLAREVPKCAPRCCAQGLVTGTVPAEHSVLADGGIRRTTVVPPRHWDPFRLVKLLREAPCELQEELEQIRLLEYRTLLEYCIFKKIE